MCIDFIGVLNKKKHSLKTYRIGIDKKSKSNSFFCFSLYTDKVGVFMKSLSVCVCVCVCVCPVQLGFVEPECGWTLLLGVQS